MPQYPQRGGEELVSVSINPKLEKMPGVQRRFQHKNNFTGQGRIATKKRGKEDSEKKKRIIRRGGSNLYGSGGFGFGARRYRKRDGRTM